MLERAPACVQGEEMQLSVVLGTYNRLNLLKQCVDSIFSQTQTSVHLFVTDAGSTDGTVEYLKSAASEQVTPIFEGRKLGQARAYNAVFEQVTTPYVCWLSDDNVVVNGGLDIAVDILEGAPRLGMVALKTKDVQGPFVKAPYIGGVSQIGVLNVNQGLLRTDVLKQVGGFSDFFRDYGIDPDLTAKVLFSGYDIAYTRQVALHHYRDWGEDAVLQGMQEKQKIYQQRYFEKYRALAAGGWGWQGKRNLWLFLRRGLGLQNQLNSPRPVFGSLVRDWHNIFTGRYISLLDSIRYQDQPYHLVQHCRRSRLPDALPDDPERPEPISLAVGDGVK
jgi:GT2 family glycosyltransferase